MVPTNTGIFLRGLKLNSEKVELSKCFWYPKSKLGVTMHFSEIIKLQLKKKKKRKRHTLLCILLFFRTIVPSLYLKVAWLAPIFFLDFNCPCKGLLSPHSHKPRKNTSLLVGTVLKYVYYCLYMISFNIAPPYISKLFQEQSLYSKRATGTEYSLIQAENQIWLEIQISSGFLLESATR